MNVASLKLLTRRPPVIVASLVVVTVLAFLGVNRLVNRFREQEKALARHLYEHGIEAQSAGQPERAVESFRAALGYAHDNFDYQLGLARALRDTGRTAESETYLISLWERAPQEGAVNLALGRLFARERLFDKAIQYYHNAIYGLWPGDPDAKRRDTEFELIALLLQHQAYPQAQAELITTAAALPDDPGLRIRVAQLFAQAQDYEHALAQFQQVLRADRDNQAALYGAGEAAFHLGRYRTAQGYLRSAVRRDPQNTQSAQSLKIATLVLDADPFAPRISDAERSRRGRSAFQAAGDRLDSCATSKDIDLSPRSPSGGLPALKAQWLEMAPKAARLRPPRNDGALDEMMDLVFEIEQQTQATCGTPEGLDQALLLLSQDRNGVER
ncbi:MAG: tetratricopeptide repeat protein [Terriglobales bacterium]